MGNFNWKDIAELVGITAIVASLIIVALQIQQSQEIAIAEARASRQAILVELDSTMAEHADIWAKGNAGKKLDPSEQIVFDRLINSTYMQYWTSYDHFRRYGQDGPLELAVADFAIFLYSNPGARKAWSDFIDRRRVMRLTILESSAESYRESFVERVLADLDKLDKLDVN